MQTLWHIMSTQIAASPVRITREYTEAVSRTRSRNVRPKLNHILSPPLNICFANGPQISRSIVTSLGVAEMGVVPRMYVRMGNMVHLDSCGIRRAKGHG